MEQTEVVTPAEQVRRNEREVEQAYARNQLNKRERIAAEIEARLARERAPYETDAARNADEALAYAFGIPVHYGYTCLDAPRLHADVRRYRIALDAVREVPESERQQWWPWGSLDDFIDALQELDLSRHSFRLQTLLKGNSELSPREYLYLIATVNGGRQQ